MLVLMLMLMLDVGSEKVVVVWIVILQLREGSQAFANRLAIGGAGKGI